MEEHAKVHMTARSFGGDERLINRHIRPALGGRKVAGVTRDDVTKLHYAMRNTPVEANRTVGVMSRMFNVAEGWKLRAPDTNPTHKLKKYKETARRRFLSDDETARLGAALAEAEHTKTERPASIAAVRLLLLTGCRLGEILTLQWDWVDIPNACIRLPQSKTGPKDVHLNAPALEVLTNIERHKDNPHVIIGTRKGRHLVNLQKPWTRIKKKAGLNDLRLHDLRHTFASVGVARGLGLPIIGKALGHNSTQTTGRYAHLDSDPVKQAVEIIGTQIAAAMKGESAEVVSIQKRGAR